MKLDKKSIRESIEAKAHDLGFSFISFTKPDQTPHYANYLDWVKEGLNASMAYLVNPSVIQARKNPASLLPEAKSVIVFGQHYQFINHSNFDSRKYGVIASYALYPDYHYHLKQKAGDLIAFIESLVGHQVGSKIFVDSSHMMEKDFAYQSGAGGIGKHSLLIVPHYGSNCMIGCIMTNLDLAEDSVELQNDLCQDCHLCIDACPTHCIKENHTIDASRCISYLTIENKGIIPHHLRKMIGNHIFGCDQCQMVCPLNRDNGDFNILGLTSEDLVISGEIDLLEAITLTKESFENKFENTPISRATYEMFLRNVIIAIGNSKSTQYSGILKGLLERVESSMIRCHAVWALGEINGQKDKEYLICLLMIEKDENVIREISWFIN